ncbi:MAG: substrate-binding domain-containing protein [Clostridiaceae bacterium]|nr:substrate-binding domain-containing protein [Clostridiaceae bacterium]
MKKHKEISNIIKDEIKSGNYQIGDKIQGENILSERFKVSRQTIRRALSTLEHEGYLERIQGSGTYVKRTSIQNSSQNKTICVMTTYLDDYIFPFIISGIEKVLAAAGYEISLKLTRNKITTERSNLISLINSNICGLIVEGTKTALPNPNLDLYKELNNIPILFINSFYHQLDNEQLNYIVVDDKGGAYKAVKHLIDNGHKKISGIFKVDDIQGHSRFDGFVTALYDVGLSFDESNVIWYSTETRQDIFSVENAQALVDKLKDCTGVVCYNDEIAVLLIRALQTINKKVPDDISIVSFDNSQLSHLFKMGITSISHPGSELGEKAANSILKMIEDPSTRIHYTFDTELVLRDSVKNLRNP